MEVPPEEKFGIAVPVLWENIGRIAKAVDKKFGAEGRNLLRQVEGELGSDIGEMLKPMCPGEDFKSVGKYLTEVIKNFVPPDVEIKVVEEKEDELVVRGSRCALGLEGTSRELCEAMMALDKTVTKTVGPNVTLEIIKTVAAGDPYCEYSIQPKK